MYNNRNTILYLIGGVPRSGKGYVRAQLLEKYKIAGLDTDTLRGMLQIGLPTLGINHRNEAEINAPKMFPFLKGFIENILVHKSNYVLEGIELLPSLVSTLLPNERIKPVFLGCPTIEVEKKMNDIRHYASEVDWTSSFDDDMLRKVVIDGIIERSKRIRSDCEKYHLPFFDTSKNFPLVIENVINVLMH